MNKWLNSTVKTYLDAYGVRRAPIVYEVGSRDGNDGVEIAQRISTGHIDWNNIVLFECNPPQKEVIRRSYPNAVLIPEAISNKPGTVEFMQIHGDKNMVGSSTLNTNRNDPWIRDTSIIEVKTRRLDNVIEGLGHQNIDIDVMKIDIEGYTWEALESLEKYLRNVRVFHLETETEGYARNKTNLDIALYMQEKGYKCKALEYEWPPSIQDQVWIRF